MVGQKQLRELRARPQFYGTTIVGERGQTVIPAEVRKIMDLKKGDKLLVFGTGNGTVSFTRFSQFKKFADHLSKRVEGMKAIIKKNK